jgi:SHS2 domain-containing protein
LHVKISSSKNLIPKTSKLLREGTKLFPWILDLKIPSLGEKYDKIKHTQGTEIKAITYSNMQVIESNDFSEVYVIVDI